MAAFVKYDSLLNDMPGASASDDDFQDNEDLDNDADPGVDGDDEDSSSEGEDSDEDAEGNEDSEGSDDSDPGAEEGDSSDEDDGVDPYEKDRGDETHFPSGREHSSRKSQSLPTRLRTCTLLRSVSRSSAPLVISKS